MRMASAAELTNVAIETVEIRRVEHSDRDKPCQGPKQMQVAHLLHRPLIRVTFGSPIQTSELPFGTGTTIKLTRQLQAAIGELRSIADSKQFAA